MRIQWQVQHGVRCDLVTYGAVNLAGKRSQVRVFPGGGRQGDVASEHLQSLVIRAPAGTRVVLVGEPGPYWQRGPWRCLRVLESVAMAPSRPGALPGLRVPDLDLLDAVDAKRTGTQLQASYPFVDTFEAGSGWTFGRGGGLKGAVRLVRVERDRIDADQGLTAVERALRTVLESVHRQHPAVLDDVLKGACDALRTELAHQGHLDTEERSRCLEEWARGGLQG